MRRIIVDHQEVRYFVFDIESVADGELIARVRYPGDGLSPAEAVARYRGELLEKYGTDFVPYTFQIPVSVVVAKVDQEFRLGEIALLDAPDFRPHEITSKFWRGWEAYHRPTLVSFNGRTFDLPLMELAAFRYGVAAAGWFDVKSRTYDQPRNRYNLTSHMDLHDILTNFGAARFNGGLNLAATILGKPGKMEVQGHMVQDMYDQGRLAEINRYCCCDVLDTYFVLLRVCVIMGRLTLDQEQQRIEETKSWLQEQAPENEAFASYLGQWGDWANPWAGS